MKKIILTLSLGFCLLVVQAQSEKYTKAMQQFVPAVDSTIEAQKWLDLANAFQRIADAEKTQWLPYYYAALCQVNYAYTTMGNSPSASVVDPIAEKAEDLIGKAEKLVEKENSEIFCVKKMAASIRMIADPMNRFATYGAAAEQYLKKAETLDPENPRVYLLAAQDKFYTPEQYGGSKIEAKALFEKALQKYSTHQPGSGIHPSWGKPAVNYFMSQF